MSLVINITTPEGIVMAADSRQSYRNQKGAARIGSDNASKLFKLNDRIAIAATGLAFLPENGMLKNISKYIDQYKREEKRLNDLSVKEAAEGIYQYFGRVYDIEAATKNIIQNLEAELQQRGCKIISSRVQNGVVVLDFQTPNGQKDTLAMPTEPLNFTIAGYNKSFDSHEVYVCRFPGGIENKRTSKEKGKEYGASWDGQGDLVARMILGFDGRIGGAPFFMEAIQKHGEEAIKSQLRNLEYAIQWGTMTLQDAVDFCVLVIETTSAIQRFSDGIIANPGDIPGVGGPVDVAVIVPDKGFVWVKKKNLTVKENQVALDNF